MTNRKKIAIFGATGSIGKNTIKVAEHSPEKFEIEALVAQNNIRLLAELANKTKPKFVAISNEKKLQELKGLIRYKCEIIAGRDEVEKLASRKFDLMVSAITGFAGMIPTVNAIKAGSNIAIANKESLVCAGRIIFDLAKQNNVSILPIDSEHNAIFQVFDHDNLENIKDVILTASGGPFLNLERSQFNKITVAQALNHPNWKMGNKITIDSATMMNKGLEMIEAFYLFPIIKDQIKTIIHPQSIIHGIVNYRDGSSLAMMSNPDMKTPISFALNYPKREVTEVKNINFAQISKLEFYDPDLDKFSALKLCSEALEQEGNSCTILNAANEIAVAEFLNGKINFTQITETVEKVLNKIPFENIYQIEDILNYDNIARQEAKNIINND